MGDCGFVQLSPAALSLVAEFFKVLSEASRLQIVCSLRSGQKNVTEIIEATGLGQANVSKHLKLLAKSGVVTRRQEGVCVYYQIANPFVFQMCELVCNALSAQLQEQHYHLEQLATMRQRA
ncbi:ArsR/SmtB family transcription factor [Trichothermofontia sp.]